MLVFTLAFSTLVSLSSATGDLLQVLVQDLIDEHVVVVHRDVRAELLLEGQGDGVGLAPGVAAAALQVAVVKALPSAQAVPRPVEAKAGHQDQVQSAWMENSREQSTVDGTLVV